MKSAISAIAIAASVFVEFAVGQNIGTNQAEVHPSLTVSTCTKAGGCTTKSGSVVLDANWRWTHTNTGTTNCYTGNTWDATLCPDDVTCAANCALDGANYASTYGITSSGNSLRLNFVTVATQTNVGSRTYLMDTASTYQLFHLKNQEFTFDVDVSNLPCGLNGALYFSEMSADGGMAAYPTNKAGAAYGTGYCDSQCPRDLKFINGQANVAGWTPASNSANSGTGNFGSCCNEMDIWEANSMAAAVTPHTCTVAGQYRCTGTTCGIQPAGRYAGVCDPDGCDFNSYRMGAPNFYGPGLTVDTTKPFTVVTQFITTDGTASGALNEIKRFYVQGGVVIPNSMSNIPGLTNQNSITDAWCASKATIFGDSNGFETKGGLATMGNAFTQGMVLVMSIWDDYAVNMLWLDSAYPPTKAATAVGVTRGPCSTSSGVPTQIEAASPGAHVIFSNIKWGDLNSTFAGITPTGSTTSPVGGTTTHTTTSSHTTTTTTTTPGGGACQTHWGQCAGNGWTGPTTCCAPQTCKFNNAWYSQCL